MVDPVVYAGSTPSVLEPDDSSSSPHDRAEPIIAEIYRQVSERRASGERASRVLLSRTHYELLQHYRAGLGDLPADSEYLRRYEIFGLEFHLDERPAPKVE